MRIVLILVQFVVFVFAVLFLVQNQGQMVEIRYFWLDQALTLDIIIVMLAAFTFGGVITWVVMSFLVIQSRGELKKARKRNRQLQSELESLRNVSIDEIPDDEVLQLPAPVSANDR